MRFKNLFFLLLSVALLTAGCSKKSDNPVNPDGTSGDVLTNSGSMVLNGAGFSNKTVELSSGVSAYTNSNNYTVCVLYGKSSADSMAVIIAFSGKNTGSFDWQGLQDSESNYYYDGCTISMYGSNNNMFTVDNGKTVVNVFGEVGKTIEGTFSGSLKSMDGSQSMTVTGSFKCLRVPDEQ